MLPVWERTISGARDVEAGVVDAVDGRFDTIEAGTLTIGDIVIDDLTLASLTVTGSTGLNTLTTSGTTTLADSSINNTLLFRSGTAFIGNNTVDGADNRFLLINGGGGTGSDRGSRIQFSGNEVGGELRLVAGNVPGGIITFYTTTILRGQFDANGLFTVNNGLTVSSGTSTIQNLSSNGTITFTSNALIAQGTSDGADNREIVISGGGANDISRGARIAVFGNEHATNAAKVQLRSGVNGAIEFYTNSLLRGSINNAGLMTLSNGLTVSSGQSRFEGGAYAAGSYLINNSGITSLGNDLVLYTNNDTLFLRTTSANDNGAILNNITATAFKNNVGADGLFYLKATGAWTFLNGSTLNIGTSGTTSALNVRGLITGFNGITVSSGTTSVQDLTVGTTLNVTGLSTLANISANSLIEFRSDGIIDMNTTDGADTRYLLLTGGGADGAGRGGRIVLSGNDRPTFGGRVQFFAGGTAAIEFYTNNDQLRGTIDSAGTWTLNGNISMTGRSITADSVNLQFIQVKNGLWTSNGNDIFISANSSSVTLRPTEGSSQGQFVVSTTSHTFRNNASVDMLTIDKNTNTSTFVNGSTVNIGTSGTTSTLNVYGNATVANNLTLTGNLLGGTRVAFTPVLNTDTTVTYITQSGFYYRMGPMIFFTATIATTSAISIAPLNLFFSLPFQNLGGLEATVNVQLDNYELPSGTDFVTGRINNTFDVCTIIASRDNLGRSIVQTPTTAATRTVFAHGWYFIA